MGDGGEDNPVLYDTDTGETKDDISVPEGDMREKMKKLFADEEKQICAFLSFLSCLLHRIPAHVCSAGAGTDVAFTSRCHFSLLLGRRGHRFLP